jgi:hypothetical protein
LVVAATIGTLGLAVPVELADAVSPPNPTSGALTQQVVNGDMSGPGLGEVGTPASNFDLSTTSGPVGAAAPKSGFPQGWNVAAWTSTGTVTRETYGVDYVRVQGSITSGQFAVANDAETITVKFAGYYSATYSGTVSIIQGSTQTDFSVSCSSYPCNWTEYQIPAGPYRGSTVRIKVVSSDIGVDDAGVPKSTTPGFVANTPGQATIQTGGPTGNYLQSSTTVTGMFLSVHSDAQTQPST